MLPYRLEFDMKVTQFNPSKLIVGRATGDVVGSGTWSFSVNNDITVARYEWQVTIHHPIIRFLAWFVFPVVRWNHDYVMRQGGQSLAKRLNANLLKIEHY